MFVWGRNNNHLFKQNHKKTYSLPQRVPFTHTVGKCVAGYDYILLMAGQTLYCYHQSALHHLAHFNMVSDIATTDNMIVIVSSEGAAMISEFSPEKMVANELTQTRIPLNEKVVKVFMNYGEVFLLAESGQVLHLKRNEWYETKSYSDPQIVQGISGQKIKKIEPALNANYFLTQEGKVLSSSKKEPTKAVLCKLEQKFMDIAASEYFLGIAENGRMYIWGKYLENNYELPSEFGKISQRFKKIELSCDNGFGVTEKGEGWVWGKNANGELGISDYEQRTQPFPLITLQNQEITDFICGEGYTVCLVQSANSKKMKIKTYDKLNSTVMPQEVKTSNNFMISSIPSISIAQPKKPKSKSPNNAALAKTQLIRQNCFKAVKDNPTPSKFPPRSKSPLDHNRSNSKSPVNKYISPYLEHQRQKSHSNIKQRKERASPSKFQNQLAAQVQELEQENGRLKRMLAIKEEVIEDITNKIRLLQEAIEEHERSLTSRDHLMQQYEKREKEYLAHIDELQQALDTYAKGRTERSSEDNLHGMFDELKNEFNREKDYYMNKMKEYEDLLSNQRSHYNAKIRLLEEQVDTYRSSNQLQSKVIYTLNDSRNDALCDRSHKENLQQSRQQAEKSRMLEDNRQRMEMIVSRIQDSKVRIGKSATKLNQFLCQ